MPPPHLQAIAVNRNTSAYMELTVRSLFACHPAGPNLALTIYDNASDDDMTGLRAAAAQHGVPIRPSGFTRETKNNSHGEILSRVVFDHPADCTHYLFLDADVCFLEDHNLLTMLDELEREPDAFGIGPRLSWDGVAEIPDENRRENPDICDARLHPCCALIKNTPLFRAVVAEVGLSCANYLWADREEYLDTFKLMTKVMRTHGQRHCLSSKMILHFFGVSYYYEPTAQWTEAKAQRRDDWLARFRARDDART